MNLISILQPRYIFLYLPFKAPKNENLVLEEIDFSRNSQITTYKFHGIDDPECSVTLGIMTKDGTKGINVVRMARGA